MAYTPEPETVTSIEHPANLTLGGFRCGCSKRGGNWWLCPYHQGYDEAIDQMRGLAEVVEAVHRTTVDGSTVLHELLGADEVPLHVGDLVMHDHHGGPFEIVDIDTSVGQVRFRGRSTQWFNAHRCTHFEG